MSSKIQLISAHLISSPPIVIHRNTPQYTAYYLIPFNIHFTHHHLIYQPIHLEPLYSRGTFYTLNNIHGIQTKSKQFHHSPPTTSYQKYQAFLIIRELSSPHIIFTFWFLSCPVYLARCLAGSLISNHPIHLPFLSSFSSTDISLHTAEV